MKGQTEGGGTLLRDLRDRNFDVSAAGWVQAADSGEWTLAVVSKSIRPAELAQAYGVVHDSIKRIAHPDIRIGTVKLRRPDESLGRWLVASTAWLASGPIRVATHISDADLTRLGYSEAIVYPPSLPMTPGQVMQTVAALMNRTGIVGPSQFELTHGRTLSAVPVGLDMSYPVGNLSGITVKLLNVATGKSETHPVTEIVDVH